jgi:hypothetical protein
VKGYQAARYPKEHLAKNSIPAPYIHHVCRDWLQAYESVENADRPDYSNYDEKMNNRRRRTSNQSIYEYLGSSPESDNALDSFVEGEDDTSDPGPEAEDD